MNRITSILAGILIGSLFFTPFVGAAQQQAMAALAKSGTVSGKITAVDMAANTVVVDVTKGKQMFTVGGPLALNAKLTKAGKAAKLSDFKQGDQVTVGYKSTANGPMINSIATK